MPSRILLVDDEAELLRALVVRLTAAGYLCEAAKDGQEALERIAQARPDLIVADLVMPRMDGYALCQHLQSQPHTATIPVVVLTAVPKSMVDERLNELKASRVMRKPFNSTELLATVQDLLATPTPGGTPHG